MIKATKTLHPRWSDKHIAYMRKTQQCSMNIAEGSIRSGKTTDNIFCFAYDLKKSKDRIHLATASTQPTAKLIIGDCDGFGLEHIFRGQCKWGKYKGNECLKIRGPATNYKEKIVLFMGGAKADSYKKFRGMSIGLWIATEINLHHADTIREAQRRQINADIKRFYWDLNPESPNAEIYKEFIDVYEKKSNSGELKGGFNLEKFNIFDNINLSKEKVDSEISKYEKGSVFYNRDILGIRCNAEGVIFRSFIENTEKYLVNKGDLPQSFKWCSAAWDCGGNKSYHAICVVAYGEDDVLYVLRSKKIPPQGLMPEDVTDTAIQFVKEVEADFGVYVEYFLWDDAYNTYINKVNDTFRYICSNAAKYKNRATLQERVIFFSQLMALGRFKIVDVNNNDMKETLRDMVYDEKSDDAVPKDDGTISIDLWDALNYCCFPEWHYIEV